MDECNKFVLPTSDTTALEEALYAQQRLLQQLNSELDVEREAAATAASEALSMILRLQGEKASLKMEANQYKRMAEEKMCHAEEALEVFEDLIYQRELEIASLEFQVQAYRYRLLSMGCNDLGVYENKFPENLLMQRNDTLFGENGVNSSVRRLKSLPQTPSKDFNHKKSNAERKRSLADLIPSTVDENSGNKAKDLEKKAGSSAGGDINSYWDQIKKLDERVKEISEGKDLGKNGPAILKGSTWSPSLFSQLNIDIPADPTKEVTTGDSDQVKTHENSQEGLPIVHSACSSSVQDIFEDPKATENCKARETRQKDCRRLILGRENRIEKPDSAFENIRIGKSDSVSEDILKSNRCKTDWVKTTLFPSSHEKKLHKLRDGISLEQNESPTIFVEGSQAEYQQLCWRIEQLERARDNFRQEITAEGEVQLNLLKGIHEQLKTIQSELKAWRAKKTWFPVEPSLDPLREAMLYFWF